MRHEIDVFRGAERSGARFGGRPQGGLAPPAGGMRDRSSTSAGDHLPPAELAR
ncbi:hypothetical protein [Rhodococcoides navarretei]|uniref:Uncharacterized protein n=1 Tax=Rhodococcus navarretei TaxID=3128981 RepID=A0ABU9D2L1_9NOCA